jgi:lipopolysaccharide transport system ATP-binding protein
MDAGECLCIGAPKQIVGRYQKLLYAPPEKREAILSEIRRAAQGQQQINHSSQHTGELANASERNSQAESFDPNLKPTSTIEYESRGANIEATRIATLSGLRVNNLVRARTYSFSYTVKFSSSASNVRFGVLIKTTSGFELGGSSSAQHGMGEPYIEAGAVVHVRFLFRCLLLPGVYFMNAGCAAMVDGEETYLHRVVDTAMFRVLPEQGGTTTGLIDFDFEPMVEVL